MNLTASISERSLSKNNILPDSLIEIVKPIKKPNMLSNRDILNYDNHEKNGGVQKNFKYKSIIENVIDPDNYQNSKMDKLNFNTNPYKMFSLKKESI